MEVQSGIRSELCTALIKDDDRRSIRRQWSALQERSRRVPAKDDVGRRYAWS